MGGTSRKKGEAKVKRPSSGKRGDKLFKIWFATKWTYTETELFRVNKN